MVDKYTYLASHLYIYSQKYKDLKEKYKSILDKKNNDLILKINNWYKRNNIELTSVNFAYYSNNITSDDDKKINGIEYTPINIADAMSAYILNKTYNSNKKDLKIIDPAVGSGVMLVCIARELNKLTKKNIDAIIEDNLYGLDNDDFQVLLTEITLSILSLENVNKLPTKINVIKCDSFELKEVDLINSFETSEFDLVITNPPYIRSKNLNDKKKQIIKTKFKETVSGLIDTYIPFFQVSMNLLKDNGQAILITPNSYFTTNNGTKLRDYLLKNTSTIRLVNFNNKKLFNNIMSYSAITYFQKRLNNDTENIQSIIVNLDDEYHYFNESEIQDVSIGDTWRILRHDDIKIIERLENKFDCKLGDLKFKNGIATQRNKIYSFVYTNEDKNYYYFNQNKSEVKIEKEITKPFITPNQKEYDIKQRIIFPYHYDCNDKAKIIDEETMRIKYPEAYKYLLSHKETLDKRSVDKNIPAWYAYGRSQGLNDRGLRLYLPYIAAKVHTSISKDDEEVFAAGYAIFSDNKDYLAFLGDILSSDLFAFYIKNVSKPYSEGFYSTAKSQIKNFSIPSEIEFETKYKINWNAEKINELYK